MMPNCDCEWSSLVTALQVGVSVASVALVYFIFDFRRRLSRFQRMKKAIEDSSSSSSSTKTKQRRLLGGMESYLHLRQRCDDLLDVCVGVIRSVDQPIEMRLLKLAAQRLAARHPTLRARIKETEDGEDDSFPYFEVDDEKVEVDVEQRSTTHWIPVVEQEMVKRFPVDGPQWRVRLLEPTPIENDEAGHTVYENPVVISVNHAICDGTSFVRLYDQLVDELCLCASSSSLPAVVSQPLLPSVEDALPEEWFRVHPVKLFIEYLGIQWGMLWRLRRRLFFPDRVPCQFLRAIGRTDVSLRDSGPKRRVLTVKISKELSEKWVRACKKNGAKHHGTMTTVANVALARAAQRINERNHGGKPAENAAPLTFVSDYPVSARPMAVNPLPPEGAIFMYVYCRTVARTVPAVISDAEFWEESRRVSEITVNHRQEADPIGNYLQRFWTESSLFPGEWRRRFYGVTPAEAMEDMEFLMSNRGACSFLVKNGAQMRQFEMTEMFVGCGDLTLTVVFDQFLTTVRGKLCWSITYNEAVISEEECQIYIDCIQEMLNGVNLA